MTTPGTKWHPDRASRGTHMAKRAAQGATVRQIASEFGVSKSHAGRHVKAARDAAEDMLRNGYTKESAK
jgi:transposase